MPEKVKVVTTSTQGTRKVPRFTTVQEFMDEYEKGSQLLIDLDPRIDFTRPVYEQVIALQLKDKDDAESAAPRRAIAE